MSAHPKICEKTLGKWGDVLDAADELIGRGWVFRGHDRADWTLKTSIERETTAAGARATFERDGLRQFMRSAPRLLPGHLVPADTETAAWLGLIQHYGGPTRLLDVTRSPYVALFFAFEAPGEYDRALWCIDRMSFLAECARTAGMESCDISLSRDTLVFVSGPPAQPHLVSSVVYAPSPAFVSFKPFTGVFPVEPWKPETRQNAQQAMFLCVANIELGFMENMAAHSFTEDPVLCKFVMPYELREEALDRLAVMNLTAATLFPDLGGLARSLRTLNVRRIRHAHAPPIWETP